MPDRINTIPSNYLNEDCAMNTVLTIELVDDPTHTHTMVVKPRQKIKCPRPQAKGRKIVPSGNILHVKFSGCNGCNAYKPKE